MNGFFAALRQEFSLRLRDEVREHVNQTASTVATLIVVGFIFMIAAAVGILLG